MKLPVLLGSFFSSLILVSCSSSKKASAETPTVSHIKNPYVKEISVDGTDADWQGIALNSSPEKTFEYSVAHNDADLFVRMKINNPVEQMKFLSGGMELWIDPTGQQKQKMKVVYPTKGELDPTSLQGQNSSGDKKQNREMMHLAVKAELISMNRVGFKSEYSGVQSIHENTGFKAAISWNDADELIYELKLPFQAFSSAVSKQNLALGFSIGALERPSEAHNSNNGNGENGGGYRQGGGMGGMRGGGGGFHGGGAQGHYGGGQRANTSTDGNKMDWQKMKEKESFWVQCNA